MFFNISTLVEAGAIANNPLMFFLAILSDMMICPMMPRLIITMRVLYDRDVRCGWQGVDNGFGVLSQAIANQSTPVSAIAFADAAQLEGQDEVVEGDMNNLEGIRLKELGDYRHQV